MITDERRQLAAWIGDLRRLLAALAPDVPLPPAMDAQRSKLPAPTTLPVLGHLRSLASGVVPASKTLAEDFGRLAPLMHWRQTYGTGEADAAFLRSYGWAELAGAGGLVRVPRMSAGLLLLGPDCHYPAHSHPAHEYYVPLAGTAHWWDEEGGWREVPPLRPVVHRSGIAHAMQTGAEPLLAYLHWSGEGLDDRARFSTTG